MLDNILKTPNNVVIPLVCLGAILSFQGWVPPQALSAETTKNVFKMDIRQLMRLDLEVTSASRRPQKPKDIASAVTVLTQEDIRRSGAQNVMEALRMVPGLQVSKLNQNEYIISSRGFNRQFQTKLLVLVDGRSIYRPTDGNLRWFSTDVVLEDVDQIEVVRGPGAALWGSNAVSGVVNIITKSAEVTQGVMVSGGKGNEENGFATVRYGGNINDNFNYRVYSKYRDRDQGVLSNGSEAFDGKEQKQFGFRSDWQINPQRHLTVQGDYYDFDEESSNVRVFNSFSPPFLRNAKANTIFEGGNALVRWKEQVTTKSKLTAQAYYDRAIRRTTPTIFTPRADIEIMDIDLQYDNNHLSRQNISVGFHYRNSKFNLTPSIALQFPNQSFSLFGVFLHDEIEIIQNKWNVVLGSKFERNKFTGWEIQPNIRTIWKLHENHSLWAAVSKAVRLPTPSEDGLFSNASGFIAGGVPVITRLQGNPNIESEDLISYEAGYRAKLRPDLTLDLSLFWFQYDDLMDLTIGATTFPESTPAPFHLVLPLTFNNGMETDARGLELALEWKPLSYWTLNGSYSYLNVDMKPLRTDFVSSAESAEQEPKHQVKLRSYLNLPFHLQLDTFLYYQSFYGARNRLDDLARLDVRLGWKPRPEFELSLVGQNLQEATRREFNDQEVLSSLTQRSYYVKGTLRF